MKKIVIHGASGLKNSGDEAILKVIVEQSPKNWEINVISFDKEYTRQIHPEVNALQMGKKECLTAIDECDGFILGGGGLLQDETSIYNVSRWLRYLRYAIKKKKPVFLYANSVGPIHFDVNKWMMKSILKKVEGITVRDPISLEELKKLGIADKAIVTADPVFSVVLTNQVQVPWAIEELKGMEYVAICVRHWYDTNAWIPVSICTKMGIRSRRNEEKYQRYICEMAKFAQAMERMGKKVVFIPFLEGRDKKVSLDICRIADISERFVIDTKFLPPERILQIIKEASLVVGMRLHSIIYASVAQTPVVGISYSQKVSGMLSYMGCSEYSIKVDELECERLLKIAKKALKNSEKQKIQLKECVEKMKEKEKQNMILFQNLVNAR